MFLARLCPSLPIIWKLFWLVVWPVWMLWWWMAEVIPPTPANTTPAVAHLPPEEGSNFPLATVHLPLEGSSSSQAILPTLANTTLAIAHLPPWEGSNPTPRAAHLPLGKDSSSSQATVLLPSGEGNNASPSASLPPHSGENGLIQAGQGSNNPKAVRQGNRCSPRHRATQSSQESPITSQEDNPSSTPQ